MMHKESIHIYIKPSRLVNDMASLENAGYASSEIFWYALSIFFRVVSVAFVDESQRWLKVKYSISEPMVLASTSLRQLISEK